jgi:ABC-type phosphate/phosphonate transport system substrate-binding protein
MLRRTLLSLAVLVSFSSVLHAQAPAASKAPAAAAGTALVFAVEPNYSEEQAAEVFKPFLEYLSRSTGLKFELKTFRNYSSYWQEMRANKGWDLVFDEAHFTDYRIQRMQFQPLVRTAESGSYVLATADDVGAGNTDGLLAEKLMTMPAPSLGYALLLEYYPNPMQQPDVRTNSASWQDAVDAVFAEEARGAMIPSSVAGAYPNLVEVVRTREFAGPAISASSRVPAAAKTKITEALLKMHEDQAAFEALTEIRVSQFLSAKPADYLGSEKMLKDFYGYGQ